MGKIIPYKARPGAKGRIPWNKGIKWLQMTGENNPMYGKTHSPEKWEEIKKKFKNRKHPKGMLGKKHTEETKYKMSQEKKGIKNINWKNENVGYGSLHSWVRREKGEPEACSLCGSNKYVEWANISGEYKRDIDDFMALCAKCHRAYDNIGQKVSLKLKGRRHANIV